MRRQEKNKTSYLAMLICYTFLAAALAAEILLLGWEGGMVVQLAAELLICWLVHVLGKTSGNLEKWLYFALGMHGYVYHGLHAASIYSLAPLMIGIILLYFAVEEYNLIRLCALVYLGTLTANLLLASGTRSEWDALSVLRLVSGGVFLCLSVCLVKLLKERRLSDRKGVQDRIAELEEENQRTEDFLTNVSHELRTPINAVTGFTAMMLKNETDGGKRENLLSIQKAGYRLFRQIEDILDYTELGTGKMLAEEEPYMLSSLINDLLAEGTILDGKENLELIFDVEAKIPAVLIGDSRKIKKILRHLLDNAVKFTEEGGIYVRLYALPKEYGINLCIQVKDTGIGMDAESLSKITEKFYQSSRGRDRRAGGLGLGLPIVYGMASAMEGFVHLESSPDGGTTVTVSIPQKIGDDAPGMKVDNPSELCLACYLMPEKYRSPEVRKFYDEMITHIAQGLDISVHRVFQMEGMEKLVSMYRLTHVFLAKEEYEANPDYFENLDPEIQVVVVADGNYSPVSGSRVKILRKPFYCFPVVNLLNSTVKEEDAAQEGKMICPDVKVLVVDDEPMNRMVAEGILKDYQMKVQTAGSGMEALSICEKDNFDLIFLDHMMPGMDGVETLRHLRRMKSEAGEMTVIAFTANAVSNAREMFLKEGFDEFLPKPVEEQELERVLKKVLPKSKISFQPLEQGTAASGQLGEDAAGTDGRGAESKPALKQDARKEEGTPREGKVSGTVQNAPGEAARLEEAGINTAEALSYCRNDWNFYLQLLEKFVADAPHKAEDIEGFYGNGDYDNYRIQVHSLKSTSRMMGADALSQMAKDLESAAKENDRAYIEAHHRELLEEYRKIAEKIREAVGGTDGAEPEGEAGGTEISREELLGYQTELGGCFEAFEADRAQKLIADLENTVLEGRSVRKMLETIKRDVEDFEYEAAAEKTSALAERLKGGEA